MSKITKSMKATVSGRQTEALGALVQATVAIEPGPSQVVGGTLIAEKVVFRVSGTDAGDGPFLCGVATGALTALEIAAAINNDGPSGPAHSTQTELSSRFRHIRVYGVMESKENAVAEPLLAYFDAVTKMGWAEQDAGWNYWVYLLGADLTSGSTLEVVNTSFVVYDKD